MLLSVHFTRTVPLDLRLKYPAQWHSGDSSWLASLTARLYHRWCIGLHCFVICFNVINSSALISNTLKTSSVFHHTLSVKQIQASRYIHEHAVVMLVMHQFTFATPSIQRWHLNRKIANICPGNKSTISTSTSDPLSLSLNLRRPMCWGKWRQEGEKKEERDITVCVCHLTF